MNDDQIHHYVGLDLSLTNTGVAILTDNLDDSPRVLSIKTTPKYDLYTRAEMALGKLEVFLNDHIVSNKITHFFTEGFAFGATGQIFNIAEFSGIIKYHINKIWFRDSDFFQIPPTSLKKFITGKGTAKKELMIKEVYKRYQFDTNDDNAADAFSLAVMGRAYLSKPCDTLTDFQKDALLKAFAEKV